MTRNIFVLTKLVTFLTYIWLKHLFKTKPYKFLIWAKFLLILDRTKKLE